MSIGLSEKVTLNVTEVSQVLGVSKPVVYQLIHRSDFPSFKIGARTVVPRIALEEWANIQAKNSAEISLDCN